MSATKYDAYRIVWKDVPGEPDGPSNWISKVPEPVPLHMYDPLSGKVTPTAASKVDVTNRYSAQENQYDVYFAGSLANNFIPEITRFATEEYNLRAFSEWFTPGPEADVNWRNYERSLGYTFVQALARPAAQHIYNFDKRYIDASRCMVLVGPAGKSAHLELGYVLGQGKPGFIYLPEEPERWDVMYNFATKVIINDLSALFDAIQECI